MEDLYSKSNMLLENLQRHMIPRYDGASDEMNELAMYDEIESTLKEIEAHCSRLETLVAKEPPHRRNAARIRLDQLRYDYKQFTTALRGMKSRKEAHRREEMAREELLTRRYTTPNDTAISMSETYFANEHTKVRDVTSSLDNMLDQGREILGSLRNQGDVLQGARRRMVDIGQALGLSQTVMRLIEKRATGDKIILFSGMGLFTTFMVLVWVYLL